MNATLDNSKTPLVVTIGGGTGQFTILTGLKEFPVRISAIVSMADEGGSSGVLRDSLGVLPPGDVRQCLAALSRETPTVRALFSYRFPGGPAKGAAFGNLFLSALEKITGSFAAAVLEAGRIMNTSGEVIPVTEGNMRLSVELKNGEHVLGEQYLDGDETVRTIGVKNISLRYPVEAQPQAVERIKSADAIVIGPGDLYGSVLPPLLVPGIANALKDTTAPIIYVVNLTNKKGQTNGFTAHDYAHVIHEHVGAHIIDTLICNTKMPPPHLIARYEEQEGKGMVVVCTEKRDSEPYHILARELVSDESPFLNPSDVLSRDRSFIRHDPIKLAAAVMEVLGTSAHVQM